MVVLLSDVSNVLQKVIMPYIRDNFPTNTILLDKLKKNSNVTYMNNNFYAPIRSGRHGGVGILANDGNPMTSHGATFAQLSEGVRILYGAFDISKLTIEATKSAKGAVESQLTTQAKSLASDFAKLVNKQYFSDGAGAIAQAVGSTSTSVQAVEMLDTDGEAKDSRIHDRYGSVNGDVPMADVFNVGMAITCGSGSGSVGTIGTVATSGITGTITFNADISSTANAPIYIVDADGEGGGTASINGLGDAMASDRGGTSLYAGTTRATYGMAAQFGSTSQALTLSAMEDSYLSALKLAQKGDQYAIFVNKSLYKKYGDILTAMRRSVNESDMLGGWTGLEFAAGGGKVGVFLDYDCPDGEVLIVNLDTFTVCQVSDLDWLEDPSGSGLVRRVNYLTYQATMAWFTNLLCLCPGANGKMTRKTD